MLGLHYRNLLPQSVADELDHICATIKGYLTKEHNDDGTHADVTASSLTLQKNFVGQATSVGVYPNISSSLLSGDNTTVWHSASGYIRYTVIGQAVFIQFNVLGTLVDTADSSRLYITIPDLKVLSDGPSVADATQLGAGNFFWQNQAQFVGVTTSGYGIAALQSTDHTNSSLMVALRKSDSSSFIQTTFGHHLNIWGSCWGMLSPNNEQLKFNYTPLDYAFL